MREKLLLTGASGFMGSAMLPILQEHYDVTTLARSASTDISVDLSTTVPEFTSLFDIVVHSAGQARIEPGQSDALYEDNNVTATANLCRALSANPPKSLVYISSVAVYGANEGENIDENHPLNGSSPYAISKIKAERQLIDWAKEHNCTLTILRPPLVVGFNPKGSLRSMIDGIKRGYYFNIGDGSARKSMVMADDVASAVMLSAEVGGIFNLSDGYDPSFNELAAEISRQLNCRHPRSINRHIVRLAATIGDIFPKFPINSKRLNQITHSLTFSNKLICDTLGWKPKSVINNIRIK